MGWPAVHTGKKLDQLQRQGHLVLPVTTRGPHGGREWASQVRESGHRSVAFAYKESKQGPHHLSLIMCLKRLPQPWPTPASYICAGFGFCGFDTRFVSCGSFSGFDNSYCGMKKSHLPEVEGQEQEVICLSIMSFL